MSKVFGTLAAVFFAASAFVAWKNQKAHEREQEAYVNSQNVENSTKKGLKKQQKRFADADDARDGHVAKSEEVQKELDKATEELSAAKKVVANLKSEHKGNESEIADANEILRELPNPTELVPKIKRMRSQLAEATSGIGTEEARLANLTRQDIAGKAKIKELRGTIDTITGGKSLPNLNARISAVYRNWGFVILSAGDKQGVVSGSVLDVIRGDAVIGKLRVTAVEAGRASADIVLDSVAEGAVLQPGDKVVAEREAAKPATAAVQ